MCINDFINDFVVVPTQKLVRFLTSSPSCVRKMLRKAELMGIITQVSIAISEKEIKWLSF